MNVAIPIWSGRISPVFDAAARLLVVADDEAGRPQRHEVALTADSLPERARQVADCGAAVLICGAISRPLEDLLRRHGVTVVPHVCGDAEEVLQCFLAGQLDTSRFLMPGCCGRRRGCRGGGGAGRGGQRRMRHRQGDRT